jgi:plastocyanin
MRRSPLVLVMSVVIACGGGGGDGPTGGQQVVAVRIDTPSATLKPGESSQFAAVGVDASGNAVPGAGSAAWSTSAASVATVTSGGRVTAVAPGGTAISATIRGVSGTRQVTVLPPGAGAVVTMPGLSFAPFSVSITRGQAVYWDFPSLEHNVVFAARPGAPPEIGVIANATVSRTFGTAGTFTYDCTVHNGMSGQVVVTP